MRKFLKESDFYNKLYKSIFFQHLIHFLTILFTRNVPFIEEILFFRITFEQYMDPKQVRSADTEGRITEIIAGQKPLYPTAKFSGSGNQEMRLVVIRLRRQIGYLTGSYRLVIHISHQTYITCYRSLKVYPFSYLFSCLSLQEQAAICRLPFPLSAVSLSRRYLVCYPCAASSVRDKSACTYLSHPNEDGSHRHPYAYLKTAPCHP